MSATRRACKSRVEHGAARRLAAREPWRGSGLGPPRARPGRAPGTKGPPLPAAAPAPPPATYQLIDRDLVAIFVPPLCCFVPCAFDLGARVGCLRTGAKSGVSAPEHSARAGVGRRPGREPAAPCRPAHAAPRPPPCGPPLGARHCAVPRSTRPGDGHNPLLAARERAVKARAQSVHQPVSPVMTHPWLSVS